MFDMPQKIMDTIALQRVTGGRDHNVIARMLFPLDRLKGDAKEVGYMLIDPEHGIPKGSPEGHLVEVRTVDARLVICMAEMQNTSSKPTHDEAGIIHRGILAYCMSAIEVARNTEA